MKEKITDSFKVKMPIEETYRKIVNNMNIISKTNGVSGWSFCVINDKENFNFSISKTGRNETHIVYRKDVNFSKNLLNKLKGFLNEM